MQVVFVASDDEAFVFDSELLGVVVFEQAQPGSTAQAEVDGGVPSLKLEKVSGIRTVRLTIRPVG